MKYNRNFIEMYAKLFEIKIPNNSVMDDGRFYNIYLYFFEINVEIDFYVPIDHLAIQVSMQILDHLHAKQRETKAFIKLYTSIS